MFHKWPLSYDQCYPGLQFLQIATKSILIAYLLWFIAPSFTTAAYSFPCIVVTPHPSVNLILPVLKSRDQAQATTTLLGLALSWTFHWIQPLPYITSSNLTTVLQNWFLHPKCRLSFQNHTTQHSTHPTSSLLSYISTLKLHSNMKAVSIKGISQNLLKGHFVSATNHISSRSTLIGVFHYPISRLLGTTYALT